MFNQSALKDRLGKKRLFLSLGAGLGVIGLVTAASFTDFANLNLGATGIGGTSSYNIQVVATDPTTGAQNVGTWQEANTAAGAPIAITGADSLFPGAPDISVDIPVKNASTNLKSSLALALSQLPDTATNITDANYVKSLRFDVSQPVTSLNTTPFSSTNLTYAAFSTLNLNSLAAGESSTVTIKIRLLPQSVSGATYNDNSLNGKQAFIQANFSGSSI